MIIMKLPVPHTQPPCVQAHSGVLRWVSCQSRPQAGRRPRRSLCIPRALLFTGPPGFLPGASEGQGCYPCRGPHVPCQLPLKGEGGSYLAPRSSGKQEGQFTAGQRASSEGH